MRKHIHLLLFTCSFFALFNSCNNKNNVKVKVATGMVIQTREQLSNIPYADIPFGGTELPQSVDMSDKMPEAGNQGNQESCVAWAIAYDLKSYQEKVELGTSILFSPSYIYNQINGGQNVPTVVTDALNLLHDQGVCLLDEMPYSDKDWTSQPSSGNKESAKRFKISHWSQINVADAKEVKTFLAAGEPVIIGAMITKEFMDDGYTHNSEYVWKDKGTPVGGHAMLVVGYDDNKNAFKIINSWGKNWGNNGYAWITYDLFTNADVVKYGFVTKDGHTDSTVLATLKTKPQNNQQQPIDQTTVQNNRTNQQQNPEVENTHTNNNPLQYDKIDFHQTNVSYTGINPDPNHPDQSMKVEGTMDIPALYGKNFQIVVHVYYANTTQQVKTLIYPQYSDVNNFVAGYTQQIPLDDERYRGKWWIHIPYSAMNLPAQKTDLYAVPTLFVDGYAIAKGEQIDFWVDKSKLTNTRTE